MAQVLGDPVASPPADGITRVRFSRTSPLLLASSWDKTARLYDANGFLRSTHAQAAALLDCCFQHDGSIFTGGLDSQLRQIDTETGQQSIIGSHAAPIKCTEWLEQLGLCLTGSWDQGLKLWDARLPPGQAQVAAVGLPGKAYSLCATDARLVVATSGRHVLVYDLRGLVSGQPPEQQRESSLKCQTRVVASYPDGRGYALGSVEGRVAMEYFDPSPQGQAAKYAFKCHRRTEGGRDIAHPVNAIAFHPGYGTFATGGSDGVVNVWDGSNKKRLFQITGYPTSVASLAFSADGGLLAVAASYMYEHGDAPHPADAIFVRKVQDVEVRPKPRQPK